MATGTGIGSLIPVAMTLVGIVTMLRARRNRRAGKTATDSDHERRKHAAAEMERRMASYLAQRSAGGQDAPADDTRQENGR